MAKPEGKTGGGIRVGKEEKAAMSAAIQGYFRREKDEELGELAAGLFLNFVSEELAPVFYNQGVYDAYRYMNERVEDMLGVQKPWGGGDEKR
jgi:uncharacterized protein (DUF2164 family)